MLVAKFRLPISLKIKEKIKRFLSCLVRTFLAFGDSNSEIENQNQIKKNE